MRIGLYKIAPGTGRSMVEKAAAGMYPIFRAQPGFIAYELLVSGNDSLVSLSTWESEPDAEKAIRLATEWVQENVPEMVNWTMNLTGDLAFSSRDE